MASLVRALERHVFARPIGSFQAIKHRLAEMAARIELARSNAWFAAWPWRNAMPAGLGVPGGLTLAAATARISAGEAFDFASRENVQIHGGAGLHPGGQRPSLLQPRARHLAVWLGGRARGSARLVAALGREAADPRATSHGLPDSPEEAAFRAEVREFPAREGEAWREPPPVDRSEDDEIEAVGLAGDQGAGRSAAIRWPTAWGDAVARRSSRRSSTTRNRATTRPSRR